jgi:hypothetical protein
VQYTITSRGRPIGVTDLGFQYREGPSRMGWFQPNADGERLMAVLTSPSIAARTAASNGGQPAESPGEPEPLHAAFLADLAEASHHVDALELELRRDDGSVVPTEFINIQDVEELLAWSGRIDAIRDGEGWKYGDAEPDPLYDLMEDVFDEELDALDEIEPELDLEPDDELMFGDGFADTAAPWTPDEYEPDPSMRYQIYVSLQDPAAIP